MFKYNLILIISCILIIPLFLNSEVHALKIGIISNSDDLVEIISKKLYNTGNNKFHTYQIHNGYLDENKKNEIFIAKTHYSKVHTAILTERIVEKYNPDLLIFTGFAEAVNYKYDVGDIIIGNAVFEHDYGIVLNNRLKVRSNIIGKKLYNNYEENLTQSSISLNLKKYNRFITQEIIIQMQYQLNKILLDYDQLDPEIDFGIIATGDQFIASENKRQLLLRLHADATDMGSASMVQVANTYDIPSLIVVSIATQMNNTSHFNYQYLLKNKKNIKIVTNNLFNTIRILIENYQ